MTDPRSHTHHDELLIAALAAGDAAGDELVRAERLVAACRDCATLSSDLGVLPPAVQRMPAPARPRDFRLSKDDAARLRRGGWRRLLRPLAGPGFAFARPVGATMASLGLAGLVLTAIPTLPLGGMAAAPGPTNETVQLYSSETDQAAQERDTAGQGGGAAPGAEAAPSALGADPGEDGQAAIGDEAAGLREKTTDAALAVLSGSFLIAGLGLFGLRWTARRLGDG